MDRTLEESTAIAQTTTTSVAPEFWTFFESIEQLNERAVSFRKIFQYLDAQPSPINIIETGCTRLENNWGGDGCSTVLFDRYVSERGGHVWSVDISPVSVSVCKRLVSSNVTVTLSDSVKFLHELSQTLIKEKLKINLCYLDSFDLDWQNSLPSSLHHLKELVAIRPALNPETLIVVDDSPAGVHLPELKDHNKIVVGKGQLVAEYAEHLGIQPYFLHYQTAWKNL